MATFHVLTGSEAASAQVTVRKIRIEDVKYALSKGVDDFMSKPTHLVFLGLFYPLFGIVLGVLTFTSNALPLIFPLVSGFAIVGPLAAVGVYEISRRRELGLDTSVNNVFDVMRSPSLPAIVAVGIVLMVVLTLWLVAALALYHGLYGSTVPASYTSFLYEVLTTPRGWALVVLGHAVGFVFAAIAFSISVVSIPLLLDHDVGAQCAIQTSVKAVMTNPGPMAIWAAVVAALLMIGSAPLLVGLTVVMPILGHATWHLYRRTVNASGSPNPPLA